MTFNDQKYNGFRNHKIKKINGEWKEDKIQYLPSTNIDSWCERNNFRSANTRSDEMFTQSINNIDILTKNFNVGISDFKEINLVKILDNTNLYNLTRSNKILNEQIAGTLISCTITELYSTCAQNIDVLINQNNLNNICKNIIDKFEQLDINIILNCLSLVIFFGHVLGFIMLDDLDDRELIKKLRTIRNNKETILDFHVLSLMVILKYDVLEDEEIKDFFAYANYYLYLNLFSIDQIIKISNLPPEKPNFLNFINDDIIIIESKQRICTKNSWQDITHNSFKEFTENPKCDHLDTIAVLFTCIRNMMPQMYEKKFDPCMFYENIKHCFVKDNYEGMNVNVIFEYNMFRLKYTNETIIKKFVKSETGYPIYTLDIIGNENYRTNNKQLNNMEIIYNSKNKKFIFKNNIACPCECIGSTLCKYGWVYAEDNKIINIISNEIHVELTGVDNSDLLFINNDKYEIVRMWGNEYGTTKYIPTYILSLVERIKSGILLYKRSKSQYYILLLTGLDIGNPQSIFSAISDNIKVKNDKIIESLNYYYVLIGLTNDLHLDFSDFSINEKYVGYDVIDAQYVAMMFYTLYIIYCHVPFNLSHYAWKYKNFKIEHININSELGSDNTFMELIRTDPTIDTDIMPLVVKYITSGTHNEWYKLYGNSFSHYSTSLVNKNIIFEKFDENFDEYVGSENLNKFFGYNNREIYYYDRKFLKLVVDHNIITSMYFDKNSEEIKKQSIINLINLVESLYNSNKYDPNNPNNPNNLNYSKLFLVLLLIGPKNFYVYFTTEEEKQNEFSMEYPTISAITEEIKNDKAKLNSVIDSFEDSENLNNFVNKLQNFIDEHKMVFENTVNYKTNDPLHAKIYYESYSKVINYVLKDLKLDNELRRDIFCRIIGETGETGESVTKSSGTSVPTKPDITSKLFSDMQIFMDYYKLRTYDFTNINLEKKKPNLQIYTTI